MPSIRSLFKRKGNASLTSEKGVDPPSTPPLSPDPDASSDDIAVDQQIIPDAFHNGRDTLSQEIPYRRFGKNCTIKSRDGIPIITGAGADHFSPSLVTSDTEEARTQKKGKRTKSRPPAKTSAFGGAPRYDWMDIETTAAIKVQSIYRRNKVLKYLDENGLSTPGMRNRRRKRAAKTGMTKSEDVPFPFSLCGVGFLFGDATLEDEKFTTSLEKKKIERKKKEVEIEEGKKRKFRMRKKSSQHLEEGIEVVESFEDQVVEPLCTRA